MKKDSRTKKWQITINNPIDKGFTHDNIKTILDTFKSLVYWVLSDEIGENNTYHTHIFVYFSNVVRFSTMQNKFPGAHFEMARGTCEDNRNYIFKTGSKWEKDKKAETNLVETHEEFGQMPLERQGQRNDILDLYEMIKSGMTNIEILEENPQYMLTLDKIERTRQTIKESEFSNKLRFLDVSYIYGRSGCGKTRSVMDKYGYANVYRVTDYKHPFDGYQCQDVVVFEEFRSSLEIQDMLNYLDIYPLTLPCRYLNRWACYTKVYIITNIPFDQQYEFVQHAQPETWMAFSRRITHRYNFDLDRNLDLNSVATDLNIDDFTLIDDETEQLPFEF